MLLLYTKCGAEFMKGSFRHSLEKLFSITNYFWVTFKKEEMKNTFQHDLNASWGDLGVEWDLGNKFGFLRFCPMDILGFIQGRRHLSFEMKIPKRFSSILKIFSGLEVPIFRLGILSANFLNFFQTLLNFQTLSSAHNKGHTTSTQMFHYHNH